MRGSYNFYRCIAWFFSMLFDFPFFLLGLILTIFVKTALSNYLHFPFSSFQSILFITASQFPCETFVFNMN